MATVTTALSHDRADRWSEKNLEVFRANKRKKSDACIANHVAILERLAAENGGYVPSYTWLNEHGYFNSYQVMKDYPAAFAHLRQEADKKYEQYRAHSSAKPQILPPAKYRNLSDYNIAGAHFNPTELTIDPGLAEGEWLELGRTLATVCQSAFWWIGDWMQYGFDTYGKKVTYDLAQQATGYTRTQLYACTRIARRFPPERRVEALTFFHHTVLAPYPPALADRLLSEACELGYTARQIRELAEKECPRKKRKPLRKKVRVWLWPETYEKLEEAAAPSGVSLGVFVAWIIEDYLKAKEAQV